MNPPAPLSSNNSDAPDWVREKILLQKVPVSRAWLYEVRNESWVRFAILRRPGNLRGIVVYHLPTFLAHLDRLADGKEGGDN
jgi:hypothetical protein